MASEGLRLLLKPGGHGALWKLARDQGIGGRLVRLNKHTNWYLSFRRSGYGGTEYFLILGDPNSQSFSRRLVFKVVRAF